MIRIISALFAFVLIGCAVPSGTARAQAVAADLTKAQSLPLGPLEIRSGDKVHKFQVELADSPEETAIGLMHRPELGRDRGMIFDFGEVREVGMYMKNTLISLDMLFIDPTGKVLAIAAGARPGSLRVINPGVPTKAVLEINGGQAEELGIKPGDTVHHAMFGNLAANDR
ncbi:DUF192 domain-containing protein [bacterium]|nr:DUF192 domain-containing protein [bacterium]